MKETLNSLLTLFKKIKMKKRVLVIVAHPDDETIWIGGTLIRNKNDWDTTIISLCRASDKDRAPKFKKACEILGAKCFISDFDDDKFNPISKEEYLKEILQHSGKNYDYVFTHGKNGEYGHIRHKEIHDAVMHVLSEGKIKSKKTFFFSYLKQENNFQGYCIYDSSATNFIKLNSKEIIAKKDLITKIYGYPKDGFEEKSSGVVEAFNELKNESATFISLSR